VVNAPKATHAPNRVVAGTVRVAAADARITVEARVVVKAAKVALAGKAVDHSVGTPHPGARPSVNPITSRSVDTPDGPN